MQEIKAAELYELLKPKTVLNIGAFDCVDAVKFAELGCEVHAFEPMAVKMHTHPNVKLYPVAVSNDNKFTQFYVSDNGCSGSLREPKNHLTIWPRVTFPKKQSVECIKLDTWYSTFKKPIDLIFADVNGSEAEMIEGATETLKNTKYLFLEVSDKELYNGQKSMDEIIAMLPGWKLVAVYNDYERFADILLKNNG
jgi:FkbM family methyltransferase